MAESKFTVRSLPAATNNSKDRQLGAYVSYPSYVGPGPAVDDDDLYINEDAENIIRRIVVMRRPRLQYWFEDFDKLNVGRVTRSQFRRALHMANIDLSDEDISTLTGHYAIEGTGTDENVGLVGYRVFCDQIDKVFTEKHLERSPTKVPRRFSKEVHPFGAPPGGGARSQTEQRALDNVMDKVRSYCKVRELVPKTFMGDFDPSNSGYITENQFRRCLEMLGLTHLSPAEVDVLCGRFKDGRGDINYRAFHDDATLVGPSRVQFPPQRATARRPSQQTTAEAMAAAARAAGANDFKGRSAFGTSSSSSGGGEVERIMAQITREVTSRRIRIKDFFRDFDRKRTGCVTRTHFLRSLQIALPNASLAPADAEAVADRYSYDAAEAEALAATARAAPLGPDLSVSAALLPPGGVHYKAFCDDIDIAFTEPGLERAPTRRVGDGIEAAKIAKAPRYAPTSLSAADQRTLDGFIAEIRTKVVQQRMALKDAFADFDRQRRETITLNQFVRVLKMFGLAEATASSEARLALLAKQFGVPGALGGAKLVHYNAFLSTVYADPGTFKWSDGANAFGTSTQKLLELEEKKAADGGGGGGGGSPLGSSSVRQRAMADRRNPYGGAGHLASHSAHLDAVMHSLREHVKSKRIRIREFFEDSDKLRKGAITLMQFKSGLYRVMPVLTEDHLDAIVERWITPGTRHLHRPDGLFVGGQPLIDWLGFCGDVDRVFTLPGLEKEPTRDVLGETASALILGSPTRKLSAYSGGLAGQALDELRLHVQTRNKLTKPDFQNYDLVNRGTLPNTQFVRALNSLFADLGMVSKDLKFEAIARKYCVVDVNKEQEVVSTNRFDVDYRSFCQDLEVPIAGAGDTSSGGPGSAAAATAALQALQRREAEASRVVPTLAGVVARLQRLVKTQRINIKALLQVHDPLRRGRVVKSKFLSTLSLALGVNALSRDEQETVCAKYAVADLGATHGSTANPDIDYRSFVLDLTSEGAEQLEQNPTQTLSPKKYTRFGQGSSRAFDHGPTSPTSAAANDRKLQSILADIRHNCKTQRMDLKPFFLDFDKLRSGKVTKNQFAGVLNKVRVLQHNADPARCVEVLQNAFSEGRDKTNYELFCNQVEWDMFKY